MKIATIRIMMAGTLLLLCAYCANMRPPTGGPIDVYPPLVVESDPPNYTVHFSEDKIVLRFDEFVSVSDVAAEVFVSPPFQNTPEIKSRGKTVIINIDETLHDSTTYSIFFGKAIKDITEGNAMVNYTYVFSTGEKIDSLSVIGEVIDAFTLKPREDVLVLLYEDNNDTIPFDSLPYLVKPAYLTRTTQAGYFILNNLKKEEYMLFALADDNLNITYEEGEEEIAFFDSLVSPMYLAVPVSDSLLMDSLAMIEADTTGFEETEGQLELLYDVGEDLTEDAQLDSAQLMAEMPISDSITLDSITEEFYTLFMFKEIDSIQRILSSEKIRPRVLRFIFRYSAKDVLITPLPPLPEPGWKLEEWNKSFDTLRYYIMNESLDTISLKISLDTLVLDTVDFSLVEKEIHQRKKERKKKQVLKVIFKARSHFDYFKKPVFQSTYPFSTYDFSRFLLMEDLDTLKPNLEIHGQAERMFSLNNTLKENSNYTLFFPDSVLTDIVGKSNDTTIFTFSTSSKEDYGAYRFNILNASPYDQLLIQLMNEKEVVLREEIITVSGTINWTFLKPGNYMIKAIGDINHNGKWDTGSFLQHLQPEPVVYFSAMIEVRSNWEFEEDWVLEFE
jgi:hypothetical protein